MKLIVTVLDGTLAEQIFELRNGHLSIGRSEHCSIRFDPLHEKIASKQHAFCFCSLPCVMWVRAP